MIIHFQDLTFNKFNHIETPSLILKTLSGDVLGTLGFAHQLKITPKFNEHSEISFDLPSFANGIPTPFYNKVTGFKIIEAAPFGKFILVNPQVKGDGISEVKSCTGYSLEYELARKKLFLPKGTYNFYNPVDMQNTIIGAIKDLAPNWAIGEIDTALLGKYRTFDAIDENLLSFITGSLQQTYHCIFIFDTSRRIIHVKDAAKDVAPLPIYLSFDNLLKSTEITEQTEQIVTELNVYGADSLSIRNVNPMGINKIYNLDYFIASGDISASLAVKWKSWQNTFRAKQDLYSSALPFL